MALLLLGLCFVFLLFVRLYVDHGVTGDEPHYLLMDYSLVHDHDFNLRNNYAHEDYLKFYPVALGTKNQVAPAGTGRAVYSIHGAGVPLLLLPGFWLAGARGAEVEMVLVAVATVWLTWIWAYEMTGRPRASAVAAGLLAVNSFFAGLAGYIYPDMPIAALTLAALIIIARYFDSTRWQVLFGVIMVAMVFMHFKTLDLALPLLAALVYRSWRAGRGLPWAAILSSGLLLIAFFIGFHHWYGVWDPEHIYPPNISLKTSPLRNVPAMLFDVKRGALIYNPALLLMLVGLGAWFRQKKEMFLLTLLAIVPSMAVLAVFNAWEGGYAPTGRYMIDFLPALFPAVAFAVVLLKANWQKAAVALIVLATLFITLESTFIKAPYINGEQYRPHSAFFNELQQQTGIGFQHLLPNYSKYVTLDDRHGQLKLLIGWLAVLSFAGYGYYLSRPLKPLRPDKAAKA
ncbi:MAG: hypothetical protein ACREJM_14440 [Candidatus Saccharimonadales bacterium]